MLFKKEQKNYFTIDKTVFITLFTVIFWKFILDLFLNKYLFTNIFFLNFNPINTKPTGFFLVPPLGPAIPVMEIFMWLLLILLKLLTIDKQHWTLTAPYFLIILFGTLSIFCFAWFEYVTSPRSKTFDEPALEVIILDKSPPVQDSAKLILSFFFF